MEARTLEQHQEMKKFQSITNDICKEKGLPDIKVQWNHRINYCYGRIFYSKVLIELAVNHSTAQHTKTLLHEIAHWLQYQRYLAKVPGYSRTVNGMYRNVYSEQKYKYYFMRRPESPGVRYCINKKDIEMHQSLGHETGVAYRGGYTRVAIPGTERTKMCADHGPQFKQCLREVIEQFNNMGVSV